MFEHVRNYGSWAWTLSSDFESRKCEFELAYSIVVLISMKSEYKMLDGNFKFV